MFRKPTNSTLQSASEARRRPTFPNEISTGRVQDRYPAYEDFPWEKIEGFLKIKWPQWENFNAKHVGDSWEFEIPELLNEGDRKALRRLRDKARTRGRSESPEP